eukprot:m.164256 g.164256  ORF g.164256 m.164256 type:complete len:167 (-) comp16403_c8_seq1:27-527(-)
MLWLHQRAAAMRESVRHVLELYAGAGTYTPVLGHLFEHVTTVEISAALVAAARRNAEANKVQDRVTIVRAPVEECRKMVSTGEYKGHTFDAVMLDPPRSGTDHHTLHALHRYKHVILLSCNPLGTFPRDLAVLEKTHFIASAVLLDHFPQTKHFEAALHLVKRAVI